ncbi:MAG: glutamyl-tRNA reductase [Chloroflexi bacterium]|nr:glutamyl-tRNA reductase [Chloroflexota bacterium]
MPQSHLVALGVSFRTAPLGVRERLAIGTAEVPRVLHELRDYADEALVLSTCNRSEIYLVATEGEQALAGALGWFMERSGIAPEDLAGAVYRLTDGAAVHHLLEVAAGMDSLVPGEHEILAQIRGACQAAHEAGALGPVLERLGQAALRTGKRARSETAIGRHAASVSLAAVRLAQEALGSLQGRVALVLGAGKTANLVAQALRGKKLAGLHVVSRRLSGAQALAARVGAQPWEMAALPDLLPHADLVLSATSAPGTVLTASQVAAAHGQRAGRPLLLMDLAVPRDIDPQVRGLGDVALYDLDDLRVICERNKLVRIRALAQVGIIVQEEAASFSAWWQAREALSALALLRTRAETVRHAELARTLRKLPHLTAAEQHALDAMTHAIVNKLLHQPTLYLKACHGTAAAQVVKAVFGIAAVEAVPAQERYDLLAVRGERGNHG